MNRKRIWKIAGGTVAVIVLAAAAGVGYLTVREYRPAAVEKIKARSGTKEVREGDSLTVLTYNAGYAGLDQDTDFFMDGGTQVNPGSKAVVEENMDSIADVLKAQAADVCFLQEVDTDSRRSYYINQVEAYEKALGIPGMFACNFKCDFVPYPIPPIGKVTSGIVTMSGLKVTDASRISLPESFSWPVKTCNLKRCMLETRIPVAGTDKELVMINFHLEAYDSGEGKIAQSKMLSEKLAAEYGKGNYVIAGGDFNQTFEGIDKYPIHHKEDWTPGVIGRDDIPDGFSFAVSDNVPTCRLLNGPYSGNYEDSQVYVLDGFIVSDNLTVQQVENIDVGFAHTDHQPVRLEVRVGK